MDVIIMARIVFVHGMFQNSRSWDRWIEYFTPRGFECAAPSWPLHEGEPSALRANIPDGLGKLRLKTVINSVMAAAGGDKPFMIGHSVGGLITQIMASLGLIRAGIAVNSVAPNGMLDFDLSFLKNMAVITNPLKGDDPMLMDVETFHAAFANTLNDPDAAREYARTAVHDSRNVLRDCMGDDARIDMGRPHAPLLLFGGEKDQIIPADLVRKNAKAYEDGSGMVAHKEFAERSHYICNEPGWEEVAGFAATWLNQLAAMNAAPLPAGPLMSTGPAVRL
jgi:pimeloyl-ACP methyl ester carboxylesterase